MDIINLLKYLFLGLFQGLTEPLPISSSGHLVIIGTILGHNDNNLTFEVIVNFGSLLAIVWIFKDSIIELINNFFNFIKTRNNELWGDFKYCLLLVVGTIPGVIIGFLFKDKIEAVLTNTKTIGISLLITALALYIIRKNKGIKNDHDITFKDALLIGMFQAVALVPGISRSGATIVGAMLRDLKRETALKFSFLLYIPISLGSMVLSIDEINTGGQLNYYIVGFIGSIFMTYFATKWFINIMKQGKLIYFSIYCIIIGFLSILL